MLGHSEHDQQAAAHLFKAADHRSYYSFFDGGVVLPCCCLSSVAGALCVHWLWVAFVVEIIISLTVGDCLWGS